MSARRALVALGTASALAVAAACGGGKPANDPATTSASASGDATADPSASAAPSAATAAPKGIPTTCAGGATDPCVPDPAFVSRLCNGSFPDVGLVLMQKSMPFTRAWLKGDVDGWNADGASARAKLFFDEEVLLLKKRDSAKGGMQVSGSGSYQVMRWDGFCYTLEEGTLSFRAPPKPKASSITWRYLENPTKDALLNDAAVKTANDKRNKECKGVTSGDVSLACQKADEALSAAVTAAVRGGIALPVPVKLP